MSGHGPPTRKSSSKSWESFVCVCACASTACVRAPARTRAHGACVHRERERGLGRETYIHVHQHTWNCPWMSPTTVTGDEMRGMLGASIRISLQRRHSCVTSSSSSGSSAQQRSKHSSRSSISLGAHRQNRLLLRRGISSTGWAPRRAYAYGHTGGKGDDCVRSACVARVAGPLSPRQRGGSRAGHQHAPEAGSFMQQARNALASRSSTNFGHHVPQPTASPHRRCGETILVGPCGEHVSPACPHPWGKCFPCEDPNLR